MENVYGFLDSCSCAVAARTETYEYPRKASGRGRVAREASLSDAFQAASNSPNASQFSDASRRCNHQPCVCVFMIRSSLLDEASVRREQRFRGAQIRQTAGQL
jgi:hypothetical protein